MGMLRMPQLRGRGIGLEEKSRVVYPHGVKEKSRVIYPRGVKKFNRIFFSPLFAFEKEGYTQIPQWLGR